MLVKVWEKKFPAEIRALDTADIDGGGTDEVVVASWDSRIYVLSGNGEVFWKSERQEYPCENVQILNDSLGKPYIIVASFHRKLIAFDLTGKKEWTINLKSWITKIYPIRRWGKYDSVLVSDLKGNLVSISYDGDINWEKNNAVNPWSNSIAYIEKKEMVLVSHGQLIDMYSLDGSRIKRMKMDSATLSVAYGELKKFSRGIVAVGCESFISLYDDDFKIIQKIRSKSAGKFMLTGMIDIDGDINDELIAGSWIGDRVSIYKYDQEKQRFTSIRKIKLASNPLSVSYHDVDGNGRNEIFIVDNLGKTYFVESGKTIQMDTINSHHGVIFGDILGYGDGDIIMRTNKETLACMIVIPRLHVEFNDMKYTSGIIKAVLPAGSRINVEPIIEIDSKKREYSKKTHDKKSVIYYKLPFKVKYAGKLVKIHVIKHKDKLLESNIFVPSIGKLDSFVEVVSLASLDKILIADINVTKRTRIEVTSDVLELLSKKVTTDGKIELTVAHDKTVPFPVLITIEKIVRNRRELLKQYKFFLMPIRTIGVDIKYSGVMTTNDMIKIKLINNSSIDIPYIIECSGILKVKHEGKIRGRTMENITIRPSVHSDDLKIQVKDPLIIRYGKDFSEFIEWPLSFVLYNTEKIAEKAKRIYKVTKDIRVVIKNLSAEIGVKEEDLKKIVDFNDIVSS